MSEKSSRKTDTGRGSGVTEDPFEWLQRMKVASIRRRKDLTKEDFEKLLEVQRAIKTPKMSKDEFVKSLKEAEIYGKRRKYGSLKESKKTALEWFSKQEDNWWTNEQIKILIQLDKIYELFERKLYQDWQKQFIERCKKVYKRMMKENKELLANEFIDEAYKRMNQVKPKKRSEVEQTIITRIRRLSIQRRYYELNKLMEELRPLLPPGMSDGAE